MTRVAVVDLGTNSTRLLVADVTDGRVSEVERRLTITRLGEGVDARRRLLPASIARVRSCLGRYRRAVERLGVERTLAVATSAVRDAENGAAFLGEIESGFGFTTRLLSGQEEALLTFRGVSAGRDLTEPALVLDVGGGSTELILGEEGRVSFHTSLDLGCVRQTERFLGSDPPTAYELEACVESIRRLLREHVPPEARPVRAIGVAGTVTTLATLHLGLPAEDPALVHRHRMSRQWVAEETSRLARLTLEERRSVPGIHRDRAPVIVAGALVVLEVLRLFDLDELEASESDLLHGAAIEAAAAPPSLR